jgi:hypothetical protein
MQRNPNVPPQARVTEIFTLPVFLSIIRSSNCSRRLTPAGRYIAVREQRLLTRGLKSRFRLRGGAFKMLRIPKDLLV